MLTKSRSLAVDSIAYDLEDSVTSSQKATARTNIRHFLNQPRAPGIREVGVRINSVESGLAEEDLREVLQSPAQSLDSIVVPKVNSASDLHFITDMLRHLLPSRHPSSSASSSQQPPPLRILALIESARAIISLPALTTSTPYLSGLIFAAEDFAHDLSLTRTPSLTEFLYARSAIVTAARAARLPSTIDLVCTAYGPPTGLSTLEHECRGGKGLGFNGKQVIHPAQVEVAQRVFAPEEAEVEWAVRVLVADEKAGSRDGRGAWTLEGLMIDRPVVERAAGLVRRAELCGIDVGAAMERWKGQEPE
ncbi:MAG: hypothetical protein M1819_001855 [Sarea resinae]|nr:MAG: hypothetical protein M1819_001855 [Sarea resinae]